MRPGPFFLYALVSGILWGVAYPGVGHFLAASWKLVRLWTGRFSLLLTILVILLVLNTLCWKKVVPRLAPWSSHRWNRLRQAFLENPLVLRFAWRYPRLWVFLLDRFNPQHGAGLYLTAGFTVSLLFALLFLWLAADLPFLSRIDRQFYLVLAETRHPAVTTFMLVATSLANGPVITVFTGLVLLWLVLDNRDFSALLLLAGVGGGYLLVFLLKFLFERPRPVPLLPELQAVSHSMPSGHAFTALVFCGLVIYFFLGNVRDWQSRLTLLLGGSLLASLVGFSRIYLNEPREARDNGAETVRVRKREPQMLEVRIDDVGALDGHVRRAGVLFVASKVVHDLRLRIQFRAHLCFDFRRRVGVWMGWCKGLFQNYSSTLERPARQRSFSAGVPIEMRIHSGSW